MWGFVRRLVRYAKFTWGRYGDFALLQALLPTSWGKAVIGLAAAAITAVAGSLGNIHLVLWIVLAAVVFVLVQFGLILWDARKGVGPFVRRAHSPAPDPSSAPSLPPQRPPPPPAPRPPDYSTLPPHFGDPGLKSLVDSMWRAREANDMASYGELGKQTNRVRKELFEKPLQEFKALRIEKPSAARPWGGMEPPYVSFGFYQRDLGRAKAKFNYLLSDSDRARITNALSQVSSNALYCTICRDEDGIWKNEKDKQEWHLYDADVTAYIDIFSQKACK